MKKREEEASGGSPEWMTTFSDLMNLLLCFFVLLFSMSSVDEEKFEELVASLSASFGVMEGGAASVLEGTLISSGMDNLNELDEYYDNLGLNDKGTEDPLTESDLGDVSADSLMEALQDKGTAASEEMAEEIVEQAKQQLIADSLIVDFTSQYVLITLNGALLFDSAEVVIRKDSIPLVDKVGDILKNYADHMVEITGYTDSVPLIGHPKYDDNWDLSTGRAKSVMTYLVNNKGLDMNKMKASGRGENDPIADNGTAEGRALNRRVEIKIYNEYSME